MCGKTRLRWLLSLMHNSLNKSWCSVQMQTEFCEFVLPYLIHSILLHSPTQRATVSAIFQVIVQSDVMFLCDVMFLYAKTTPSELRSGPSLLELL